MKQVTLRVPEVGYTNLQKLCSRYGISFRALFEAATLISLEDEDDPLRRASQLKMWDLARRLESSAPYREGPRRKIVVRLDDCLAIQLQAACRRHGVTQNAALALVVMPWPEETTQKFLRYRKQNLCRIVDRARQLDFVRRGSEPVIWATDPVASP